MKRSIHEVKKDPPPSSAKSPLKDKGADLGTLRGFNKRLVMRYLLSNPLTSRVEIASELGLSRATVTSIIDELIKDDFVKEGGKLTSLPLRSSGRPANQIYFNADAGYCLAVDIGRSSLTLHLTNLLARTVKREAYPFAMTGYEDGHDGLKDIARHIRDLVKKARVPWNSIRGIGVAVPGIPDNSRRMLTSPPALQPWMDIDIPATLRKYLALNRYIDIELENDANMGALGESRYGNGRGIANFIYIKIGIGIGAGLILSGALYRGSRGAAGEFGHVVLDEDLPGKDVPAALFSCPSCGKRGCLESLAGVGAIIEDACSGTSLRLEDPDSEFVSPTPARGHQEVDIADVLRQADQGNKSCRAALRHAGRRIGRAIGSCLVNVYNPSRILLGGDPIRLAEEGGSRLNEILFSSIRDSAKLYALPAAWEGVEILPGGCLTDNKDDSAIVLGAIAAVMDRDKDFRAPDLASFGPTGQM